MSTTFVCGRNDLSQPFGLELEVIHGRYHASRIFGFAERNGNLRVGYQLIEINGGDVRTLPAGLKDIQHMLNTCWDLKAIFLKTDPDASTISLDTDEEDELINPDLKRGPRNDIDGDSDSDTDNNLSHDELKDAALHGIPKRNNSQDSSNMVSTDASVIISDLDSDEENQLNSSSDSDKKKLEDYDTDGDSKNSDWDTDADDDGENGEDEDEDSDFGVEDSDDQDSSDKGNPLSRECLRLLFIVGIVVFGILDVVLLVLILA